MTGGAAIVSGVLCLLSFAAFVWAYSRFKREEAECNEVYISLGAMRRRYEESKRNHEYCQRVLSAYLTGAMVPRVHFYQQISRPPEDEARIPWCPACRLFSPYGAKTIEEVLAFREKMDELRRVFEAKEGRQPTPTEINDIMQRETGGKPC